MTVVPGLMTAILVLICLLVPFSAALNTTFTTFQFPASLYKGVGADAFSPAFCFLVSGAPIGDYYIEMYITDAATGWCLSNACPFRIPLSVTDGNDDVIACTAQTLSVVTYESSVLVAQLWNDAGDELATLQQDGPLGGPPAPLLNPIPALMATVNEAITATFMCKTSSKDGTVVLNGINLPQGATLSSAGIFAWTPQAAGVREFVVICTDSTGVTDAQMVQVVTGDNVWLKVAPPPAAINPLTPTTIPNLQKLFTITLPNVADSAPVFAPNVITSSGSIDMIVILSKFGDLLGIDMFTGLLLWWTPPAASCNDLDWGPCYTTSTPALDPTGQVVFAYQLDGFVHSYNLVDGTERTGNGFPLMVTRKPKAEKISAPLSVYRNVDGNAYLYAAIAGLFYDRGDYQGHLVTLNLNTGQSVVYNTLCSTIVELLDEAPATPSCEEEQAGIWGRAGVLYDPMLNRIFTATGNGNFTGETMWGQTVLALNHDGTGQANGMPIDSFTPKNWGQTSAMDLDIGGVSPVIVDISPTARILAQGSKQSILYLLDPANLSGINSVGVTGTSDLGEFSLPQGGLMYTNIASWTQSDGTQWLFCATFRGLAGMTFYLDSKAKPHLAMRWLTAGYFTSPIVLDSGVIIALSQSIVHAFDALTGTVLWQDAIGSLHWQVPIVVGNGILFAPDNTGALHAWALNVTQLQVSQPTNPVSEILPAPPPPFPVSSLAPLPTSAAIMPAAFQGNTTLGAMFAYAGGDIVIDFSGGAGQGPFLEYSGGSPCGVSLAAITSLSIPLPVSTYVSLTDAGGAIGYSVITDGNCGTVGRRKLFTRPLLAALPSGSVIAVLQSVGSAYVSLVRSPPALAPDNSVQLNVPNEGNYYIMAAAVGAPMLALFAAAPIPLAANSRYLLAFFNSTSGTRTLDIELAMPFASPLQVLSRTSPSIADAYSQPAGVTPRNTFFLCSLGVTPTFALVKYYTTIATRNLQFYRYDKTSVGWVQDSSTTVDATASTITYAPKVLSELGVFACTTSSCLPPDSVTHATSGLRVTLVSQTASTIGRVGTTGDSSSSGSCAYLFSFAIMLTFSIALL